MRFVDRVLQKYSKFTKFAFRIENSPARFRFFQKGGFPDFLWFSSKSMFHHAWWFPCQNQFPIPTKINFQIPFTNHHDFCFKCMHNLDCARNAKKPAVDSGANPCSCLDDFFCKFFELIDCSNVISLLNKGYKFF